MKDEFLISEIAKLFKITKRTLQYYDKIGLLTPKYIKENGYRVYGIEEVGKLMEVIIWKNLGLESDEIKKLFSKRDVVTMNSTLDEVDRKLDLELQRILFLKKNLAVLKEGLMDKGYEGVKIKEFPRKKVIIFENPNLPLNKVARMMVEGTKILSESIDKKIPFKELGFFFEISDEIEYGSYFLSLPEDFEGENCSHIERGTYACSWFEGDLKELADKVRNTLFQAENLGYKLVGIPLYSESFSTLYFDKVSMSRGEIRIPLEKI